MAVRTHLADLREEMHPQGTIYERGKFVANATSWEVGIVEVGAGNAGAGVEAERAIAYFNPSVILFVGVAGGIKDVAIGDVVAATKMYGYESGKAKRKFEPRPDLGLSTYGLIQRSRAEAKKVDWLQRLTSTPDSNPRVFVAPIAAGEKVIASSKSDVFKFIQLNYGDAVAVEMEGRGLLQAAHANHQVSALVIRGISDLIDGKSEADAGGSQEMAARNASAFAFEILTKLQIEETAKASSQQSTLTLPLLLPKSAQTMNPDSTPPKVFITYSHDSQEHKDRILQLADRFRDDGIDCNIDQYEDSPPEGWQRWMLNQVEAADFVLVVCTEQYHRRFRGHEEVGKGKGATWEGGVIIHEVYDAQGKNLKFIPVTFTPQDTDFIPSPLRAATNYRLNSTDGYELLYRRLTNQPRTRKPELGKLQTLAPRDRKQVFQEETQSPTSESSPSSEARPLSFCAVDDRFVGIDIGIIIPLKEEFQEFYKQIKEYCELLPIEDPQTGNYYYRFEYPIADAQQKYQCVATFIGDMGLVKAGLVTDRLMSRWNPTTVVMIGIAAALDNDAKLGDVVLATQVDNYLEEGKQGDKFEFKGQVYRCSPYFINFGRNFEFVHSKTFHDWQQHSAKQIATLLTQEILDQLISEELICNQPNLISGDVASASVVGAANSFKDWLKTRNRKYIALEMESAGLMAAVSEKAYQRMTLVLRGISDKGDEKKKNLDNTNSGFFRRYAMKNATLLFLYFMEKKAFRYAVLDSPTASFKSNEHPFYHVGTELKAMGQNKANEYCHSMYNTLVTQGAVPSGAWHVWAHLEAGQCVYNK
jgi:nucleoside phosphorylase